MLGTSKDIKYPGLNIFPPGVERYVVNGGGLTGIQIFPDDEIEIINDEGNQICEVIVFDKDGKSNLSILNLKENKIKSGIKDVLFGKGENSKVARYQLKKKKFRLKECKELSYFW